MTGQLVFRSPFSVHRSPNNNEPDQVLTDNGQRTTDNDFAGGHPSKDWFEYLPNSTTHIIFHFSDRSVLFFNDMRKFGWIKVIKSDELEAKLSSELGPEPLDKSFTADELAKIIRSKPKWNIKKILTDQTLISGIGNIYADEALYWAGILPTRIGGEISDDEILKLRDAIIKSLEVGLKYGGSSENTYVRVDGSRGHAQEHSQVYGREGKPCNHCQGKVEKIRLNGRGTHFCTNCQK
jgi:formamidopyrimidine-DNA glycosylase